MNADISILRRASCSDLARLNPCRNRSPRLRLAACGLLLFWAPTLAWANGGPFVIKYPSGDPAAKGVLARLDPDLRPGRESRLAVLREDLALRFESARFLDEGRAPSAGVPLVSVTATYFITNTTAEPVEVDFGFPVLRGIYINRLAMNPAPEVLVRVDGTNHLRPTLISNSAIYGLLRRRAEATIDRVLQADGTLRQLADAIRTAPPDQREPARQALAEHLTTQRGWTASEAALLVEYLSLRPARNSTGAETPQALSYPLNPGGPLPVGGGWFAAPMDLSVAKALGETAWATFAIGEQKATQWLTLLAARLDPSTANSYEAIFQAWGGDVRERSVDLITGKVRPREVTYEPQPTNAPARLWADAAADPTVYARVDYLEANPALTELGKAPWRAVLKHLPVIFTFAPMNLLHYRVAFPAHGQRTVTVMYRQYAYLDTATPRSYQVAYVVHPASLWDAFGPIHLSVLVPAGVKPVASLPLSPRTESSAPPQFVSGSTAARLDAFTATVTDKTGELFVGIDADEWAKALAPKTTAAR